jgi:ADP-heptose:LPS heptosyltransferase
VCSRAGGCLGDVRSFDQWLLLMGSRVLVARLDNAGDVLLAGPAVRAVARGGRGVSFLAGPSGAAAARLLPGVDEVVTWSAPWVPDPAPAFDADETAAFVRDLASRHIVEAAILTSSHQSPLPLALLLRLAGVGRIAATCIDYPGSLLDVRVAYEPDLHEVQQGLAVANALGYDLELGDGGALAVVDVGSAPASVGSADYVVMHPGASVPARAVPPALATAAAAALVADGWRVVLTGSIADRPLAKVIIEGAGREGITDLTGATGFDDLARVVVGARVLVAGNTGPVHLAAAVGTPVVEVFAPTVDPRRWAPWNVPHRLLGQTSIRCGGCRARRCPMPGQPCVAKVTAADVVGAVASLAGASTLRPPMS